jgi:membrane protein DedA with SNARE-associated domain/rhodanese-related sulfurtransferase
MNYYLLHTTYPILFLSVFARQLCLPVPALLFLLSAGALAGSHKLSLPAILIVSVLGCLLGDLAWFEAGRLRGKRVLKLLCAFAPDPSYCIRHSRNVFESKGLRVLLIAKFVPGLDGITPPLAGMAGVSRARFLAYDAGGSALWSAAYVGAGFVFAEELERVVRYTSVAANALILVLGVPLVAFFVWKTLQLVDMIRRLRPLRITAQELKVRLDSGEKIGVLDLLRFEDDPRGQGGIPGAVRANPLEMRRKKRFLIPDDVTVVLYCASKNSFVSARVAATMRRSGVPRVLVLDGGLAAWKAQGFPLTCQLANPATEMERLGVTMDPPGMLPINEEPAFALGE